MTLVQVGQGGLSTSRFFSLASAPFCALLLGCYSPDYQTARYTCTTTADCPPGLPCVDRVCGGPGSDAAMRDQAPACQASLSGVGAGDFSVAFSVLTKSTTVSAMLHQIWTCDNSQDFWDIQLRQDGTLNVEVNQGGGPYTSMSTTVPLNDGHLHKVLVQRVALNLQTSTDSAPSGAIMAPQRLSDLAPLAGPDPCAARRPMAHCRGCAYIEGRPDPH